MRNTAANVEMQGIEFQIINDSTDAANGIDALAQSLAKLKSSLGSGGGSLSTVAKNISAIKSAIAGIDTSKITGLGSALSGLGSATANLSISSSIGNQIRNIADAVNAIPESTGQKLRELAAALQPLTELGKQQIGSFITQLKKIPELVTELETVDMSRFKQQMEDLAAAMQPLATQMQSVANGFSAFPSRIQRLISSTNQYNSAARTATSHTTAWGKALKTLSVAAILKNLASLLGKAINLASEYTEDLNLFTVSMGEYAQAAYEYAEKVSEVMGIDPADWMRNQGVFNSIISGFGVAGEKAAFMSKNLTQLAYDLSSFYNISVDAAMQKVQSGISGELEPLRRLGYDLSVARLEQERLNLGIEKSVSDMNQAEKAQLRYYAMMTQVTQVQGDMARTLEDPANMLRVLKAQLTQAARAIGNLFIPMLTKILPVAIAMASALREIIAAIASLFGVELQEPEWESSGLSSTIDDAATGTEDIADSMDDAASSAKKLKQYLAGFDELNVMPQEAADSLSGSLSGLGGVGTGDLGIELPGYDFLEGAVTEQIDAWKKKLEPFVTWVTGHIAEILVVAGLVGGAILAWKLSAPFMSGLKTVQTGISLIAELAAYATSRFTGWSGALSPVASKIASISPWVAVIAVMVLRFIDLYKNSEKFRTGLERIGEIGEAVFSGIRTVVNDVLDGLKWLGESILDLLPEDWKNAILDFFAKVKDWLGKLDLDWKDLAITIAGIALLFVPGGQLVGAALLGFEAITLGIRALGSTSEEDFNEMLTNIKDACSHAWEKIKDAFKTAFTWIGNFAKTILNGIISRIESTVNRAINGINGLLRGFNTIVSFAGNLLGTGWKGVSLIPTVSLPRLAEGGYVDSGQLFIAREAGAEMVGSIGGKTAVANNDQITEGVAQAVFDALMETGILGYVKSIADSSERTAQKDFTLGKPNSTAGRWVSQSMAAYSAVKG